MKLHLLYPLSMLILINAPVSAQDSFPEITFEGLVDVRAVRSSDQRGWIDRGLGKTRYGADADGGRSSLRFSEASLVANMRFSWDLTAMAHFKFDPEQKNTIDMVEAFINYDPVSTSRWRFHAKAGMFFPPISLEHGDIAWTSPYSLTPSAINTWVGEEVKSTGLELSVEHRMEGHTVSLGGSAFMLNDPTGTLLAWRGWALHDIKATAYGRFALPPVDSISPDGIFWRQAPWVEPHHEIDDRVGYYAFADWEMEDIFTLSALYYNNRGNPVGFDGDQYSWHTDFYNIGLTTYLPGDIELLAQYMSGTTRMGPEIRDYYVLDAPFTSYYVLLSKMFDRHRLSLRYDNFKVEDLSFVDRDNNNENGHAIMAAASRDYDDGDRLMLELQYVNSDRANRADLNLPTRTKETQLQLSYRFAF